MSAADSKEETDFESGKRKREDAEGSGLTAEDDATKKTKSEETSEAASNSSSFALNALSNVTFPLGLATPAAGGDTILLEIAPDKVGQVIGSKGAIIQEIQTRTGAKAFVNQDFPDGVNRQVNITGTTPQVKAAAELIKLIIEHGPTAIHVNSLTGGPTLTSVLECTQTQVGKVIGTGGSVIKDLQAKSGARIQIDQDFPPEVPRKINITGTTTAVSLAVSLVQNILNGLGNPLPSVSPMGSYGDLSGGMYGGMMGQPSLQYGVGGEAKQTIDVQKSVVGKIIGKGGETITLIQRKSGAKVTVDQSVPEGQPCKVIMTGSAQSLSLASQLINEIVLGVPTNKIGANLPNPVAGNPMGGMGMSPYGGYAQPAPNAYGMGAYGMPQQMQQQMPQQMQQQMPQYGGYGYPQQQPQQLQPQMQQHQIQQQYAMAAAAAGGAAGYQSYGAAAAGNPAQN
eukprot:gene21099-27341_t